MPVRGPLRGETINRKSPNWRPLLTFAPEHVPDFMWMAEIELEDGSRVHSYKHFWTRRYLHLAVGGAVYGYDYDGRYQEIDSLSALEAVLSNHGEDGPPLDIVRQNLWRGYIQTSWARSASRHRISRARATHVICNSGGYFLRQPPKAASAAETLRLVFLGDDEGGVALEVIAVEIEPNPRPEAEAELKVIHAMRLRERYRDVYEEWRKWRR